jgi:hypothetical protein
LLQNQIKKITLLGDAAGKALPYQRTKDANGNDLVVISVPPNPPSPVASVLAMECEGDRIKLAPYKHKYDPAKKQISLDAANFQAYAYTVKSLSLSYDGEQNAIVNWRFSKGGSPTIVWTFDVPESGDYELEIDYALNKRSAGLPVDVLIDHEKQLTFTTEDSGGDTICKKFSVGTVHLEKGKKDIALNAPRSNETKLFVMQLIKGITLTKKQQPTTNSL